MSKQNRGPHIAYRKDRDWWGVREFRGGQRYWIVGGLKSEREAAEALVLILREDRAVPQERLTVGEVLAFYLDHHAPHTAKPLNTLSFHEALSPFWAARLVPEVCPALCQKYCTERNARALTRYGRPLSNGTLRRELEHLKAALNYARANGKIQTAPETWKPERPKARQRWLTEAEAQALLEEAKKAGDYLYLFTLLGLYTGPRPGAILSLRWAHVDFARGTVDYRPAQRARNKGYALVPMPDALRAELEKRRGGPMEYVVQIGGCPLKSVRKAFRTVCKRAGLEGVSPNTLRHTHGSWLLQKGIPASFVAANLGHASTDMVERVYGHLCDAHHEKIRAAL